MKNYFLTYVLAALVVLSGIKLRQGLAGIGSSPMPLPPAVAGIGSSPMPLPPANSAGTVAR